ncbi:dUTP diphosphatase [Pseudomonas stutzeri]|uniref:dUTP diphosphatase n=1 Tax=Stutzerimonas stutzeri TaxID=316 RepID=UPI00210A57A5|nr:dUTP diphosphatase [Stutzerimonas stutzeri]MCQ4311736.1 dUTP diphosphatase [Stutzerimonas stutzeri]
MQLKVKRLNEAAQLPTYGTDGAACFDIRACIPGEAAFSTMHHPSVTVPTGLAFEVPADHVMLVFSRSGHGFKNNTRLANCVGVIDSDYRGELMVKLTRDDSDSLWVDHNERIAQGMIIPVQQVELIEADELSDSARGTGGLGSTGVL